MNKSPQQPTSVVAVSDDITLADISALEPFIEQNPDLVNEARFRWWIFHRKANGLEKSGAIIKRSGRWFVVRPRFKSWLLQGEQG